jgi:hypothetical protein
MHACRASQAPGARRARSRSARAGSAGASADPSHPRHGCRARHARDPRGRRLDRRERPWRVTARRSPRGCTSPTARVSAVGQERRSHGWMVDDPSPPVAPEHAGNVSVTDAGRARGAGRTSADGQIAAAALLARGLPAVRSGGARARLRRPRRRGTGTERPSSQRSRNDLASTPRRRTHRCTCSRCLPSSRATAAMLPRWRASSGRSVSRSPPSVSSIGGGVALSLGDGRPSVEGR